MSRLRYRQSLQEIRLSERSLKTACDQMTARAVEAEKEGRHDEAVRWAGESLKLKKYLEISQSMKNRVEVAHAVRETGSAMNTLLTEAGSLCGGMPPADPVRLLAEVEALQGEAQIALDQCGQIYDDTPCGLETAEDEENERYLRSLMTAARREKHASLLRDANQRLDRLQRARGAERPL